RRCPLIRVRELYRGGAFRSWRMIGRPGARRATSLKPARANVEAVPTKIFDEHLRCARVDWISLERCCLPTLCGLHGRGDKLRHDPLPAIVPAHEETGDRPDGQIVHTLEPPHAVKPRQCVARRELTPAHWQIAVESEQTRRGAARHDLS